MRSGNLVFSEWTKARGVKDNPSLVCLCAAMQGAT